MNITTRHLLRSSEHNIQFLWAGLSLAIVACCLFVYLWCDSCQLVAVNYSPLTDSLTLNGFAENVPTNTQVKVEVLSNDVWIVAYSFIWTGISFRGTNNNHLVGSNGFYRVHFTQL